MTKWKPFNEMKPVKVRHTYKGKQLVFKVFEEDSDTSYREEQGNLSQIAVECIDSAFEGLFSRQQKYKGKHYGYMTFISDGIVDQNIPILVEYLGFDETEEVTDNDELNLIKSVLEKAGVLKFNKELSRG